MQPEKHFFTIVELARQLDVSRDTIDRWVRKGLVAVARLPSGHCRIPVTEVERICATSTMPTSAGLGDSDEAAA